MRLYTLLFLIINISAFAQSDTTWLDKENNKTVKDSAISYRPQPEKLVDGHYHVIDYYIHTGVIKMNGIFLDDSANVEDGFVVSYYEDGAKEDECLYKKGLEEGRSICYYKDGAVESNHYYINGEND